MSTTIPCVCCLMRPPDKGINVTYTILGKTEVYAEMLKECFVIDIPLDLDDDYGICEVCIQRLRDASDFKQQVQQCQSDFQSKVAQLVEYKIKDEDGPIRVKEEISDDLHDEMDDDNGIYFLELKDENSDYEEEQNLAEVLGLNDVTIKKRTKETQSKKSLLPEKFKKGVTKNSKNDFETALHSVKKLTSIKNLLGSNVKLNQIRARRATSGVVSENAKFKFNIQNLLRNSNCIPFLNKTIAGISCAFCRKTFPNVENIRSHNEELHQDDLILIRKKAYKDNLSIKIDITNLNCKLCHKKFDRITHIKSHLTECHDIEFYTDIHDYILEFKLINNTDDLLNCALCNSTFETFKTLLQHMNRHYRNFICEICDLGFLNKYKLDNHQKTHEIGTFNCTFCDKVFTTRVRKISHEKYTHNTNYRYTTNCPHCEESFTNYYQRNKHMITEHNSTAATYKCNTCEKSFLLKSKLTSHIKQFHLMERNHICPKCGLGFFMKKYLDEHMVKHGGARIFKCSFCSKAYARKKTLREHLRIHNNDRRFKCVICQVSFVQKCSLKSHMISNHGIPLAEFETMQELKSKELV